MSNEEHVALLENGPGVWNEWRRNKLSITPDLRGAKLDGLQLDRFDLLSADLTGASLRGASICDALLRQAKLDACNLEDAMLVRSDCAGASFQAANLARANMQDSELSWCSLAGAILDDALLCGARLRNVNCANARFARSNFTFALLNNVDLRDATLIDCRVHGLAAWDLETTGSQQRNLRITAGDGPEITVDSIEVAQFIYLLLFNGKLRDVIDSITSKAVLILGRFTLERKQLLDRLRDELRRRNYLSIVFDFDGSGSRSTDETVTLLARMARFVIADVTDAKSVLQELRAIVPDLPSIPVQPLIIAAQEEPGMFDFYRKFPWFLNSYRYVGEEQLVRNLDEHVLRPAEEKLREIRTRSPEGIVGRSV